VTAITAEIGTQDYISAVRGENPVPLEYDVIRSTAAQDRFPDCNDSAADQHASLAVTIWKFANAAAQAGIDLDDLIDILESGVPIEAVLDMIQSRLEPRIVLES
jgi:hypothetical protein